MYSNGDLDLESVMPKNVILFNVQMYKVLYKQHEKWGTQSDNIDMWWWDKRTKRQTDMTTVTLHASPVSWHGGKKYTDIAPSSVTWNAGQVFNILIYKWFTTSTDCQMMGQTDWLFCTQWWRSYLRHVNTYKPGISQVNVTGNAQLASPLKLKSIYGTSK